MPGNGLQEERDKLAVELARAGLGEGLKAEIAIIANIVETVAEIVPVDGADIGHQVLIRGAIVVMDVQRLDALAQNRHIDAEALAQQVEVTRYPCRAQSRPYLPFR